MRYLKWNQNDKFWYENFAVWSFFAHAELREATVNLDIIAVKSILEKDANPNAASFDQIKTLSTFGEDLQCIVLYFYLIRLG